PLRGLANVHQLDPIRCARQLSKIIQRILVIREMKVRARLVPEHRFGAGNLGQSAGDRKCERGEQLSPDSQPPSHSAVLKTFFHGITASLYCSRRSSIFDALKSFVRRSTANFFNCADHEPSLRDKAASSTCTRKSSNWGMRSRWNASRAFS